ncbi:site-specific integrase [Halorussus salinus]|uniref:hypothetical protein n=1 Tax=Halorussus salinus TaxID=1364935 RepID=UPI00192F73CD|nr:hypothetical protein [Halorussus salinus]
MDGKRGERTIHLVMSVPYLQRWLNEHPGGDGDHLWSKLSSPDRPSYNSFLGYFKNAAGRADVSKAVTPTNFRKSNTRWPRVKMLRVRPRPCSLTIPITP